MAKDVGVRCRCGEVVGLVTNASPQKVNRVICYCDDCQAFAHQLGRADLLNAQGGSDIVQVAPASLTFIKGQNRIAGVRLTPKGLFRWHTTCCNTPVGNTLGPAIPFVGLIAQTFEGGPRTADVAPVTGTIEMKIVDRTIPKTPFTLTGARAAIGTLTITREERLVPLSRTLSPFRPRDLF